MNAKKIAKAVKPVYLKDTPANTFANIGASIAVLLSGVFGFGYFIYAEFHPVRPYNSNFFAQYCRSDAYKFLTAVIEGYLPRPRELTEKFASEENFYRDASDL